MRHILFVIPVVISALVVVTLTAESDISLPTSSSTVRASADMYRCDPKSLEQVQLEFPVKEPTYLPEGYKLQVVDTTSFPGMVALYYAKYEMCHGVSLSNPGDVIVITVGDVQGSAKEGNIHAVNLMNDPVEHFKRDVESYNSVIPDAAKLIDKPESTIPLVRMIEVNGHVGKAREPMKGYNVYIINDGERSEKVVEELSDVRAGFVTFYHEKDKTMYSILSTFPVEEMLKIAKSIP